MSISKKPNNKPLISVVLPTFNDSRYIKSAIDSLLSQTFKDFELIIINDGSTDDTLEIIKCYKDSRITVLDQKNSGIVRSLNRGIKAASTNYIARQDGDDISEPTRLERQFEFMKTNPDTVIVGSSMGVMNMAGKKLHTHFVLLQNAELKQELLVRSPFAHGSVLFKKDVFIKSGGYREKDWPAEDYGLWVRMSEFGEFRNLDEPLYTYRENEGGLSQTNQRNQQDKVKKIQSAAWRIKNRLLPYRINTKVYMSLTKGEDRIERIVNNLIFCVKRSIKTGDFGVLFRCIIVVLKNGQLIRKCLRIAAVKLRFINV